MMKLKNLRFWLGLHKWSSLVAMLVLLPVFISGLPLVLKSEINQYLGYGTNVNNGSTVLGLDELVGAAQKARPQKYVQFVVWEDDKPDAVVMSVAGTPDELPYHNESILISPYNAQVLSDDPEPLSFFLDLHTKLLLGKGGTFFLGIIAIALVLSLVSGVAVYKPFAGSRPFGHVRSSPTNPNIVRWLDLHNVVGVIVFGWLFVVGFTGIINSWGEHVVNYWQYDQMAEMTKDYRDKPIPALSDMTSVEHALETATAAYPDLKPWFISMPRSFMTDAHHYTIYLRGATPSTKQLIRPVLVDAVTATITASREMPWYMKGMMLSQPLHFGDYGGIFLKIIWVLLTVFSIFVLMSGLYLWWVRYRSRLGVTTWQALGNYE